jgi:cytochrome c peroxidase
MRTSHIHSILVAAAFAGCADAPTFTEAEYSALSAMVLDDNTPMLASPTNKFADDPRAADLGHAIFFDMRWVTGAGNCRTCHDLTAGGNDTKTKGPLTVFGTATLSRNTPTIFNAAYIPRMNHWAGNFTALWSIPPDVGSSALQMAHFMYTDPTYRQMYEDLYGPMPDLSDTVRFPAIGNYRSMAWQMMAPDDQLAMGRVATNIGKSLEAYERHLIDKNSAFDRFMDGDDTALSPSAIRGAKLFVGRAGCNECHNGPTFSDFKFHNIGVPQPPTLATDFGFIAAYAVQSTYPFNSNSQFSDDPAYGASLVTDLPQLATADLPVACSGTDPMPGCGAFKTARLRSVGLTGPYMHTGGITNLWDVVAFYNEAAGTDGYVGKRDPAIRPLLLSDDDITDIVAFLRSLTGEPIPAEWSHCPPMIPTASCSAP